MAKKNNDPRYNPKTVGEKYSVKGREKAIVQRFKDQDTFDTLSNALFGNINKATGASNFGYLSKDQFIFLAKQGLRYTESTGNHKAQNETTNALGTYQFVPSMHWAEIVNFANSHPKYKNLGLKHNIGKLKGVGKNRTAEQQKQFNIFLNNPDFQEAWMNKYAGDKYYDVLNLYTKYGKSTGLRMDEMYSIIHHQGNDRAIRTGQINYKSPDGTNGAEYLRRHNIGINETFRVPKDKNGNYTGTKNQRNKGIYNALNKISENALTRINNKSWNGFQNKMNYEGKPLVATPDTSIKNVNPNYDHFLNYKKEVNNIRNKYSNGSITETEFNNGVLNIAKKYKSAGVDKDINKYIKQEYQQELNKFNKNIKEANYFSNALGRMNFNIDNVDLVLNGKEVRAQKIKDGSRVYIDSKGLPKEYLEFLDTSGYFMKSGTDGYIFKDNESMSKFGKDMVSTFKRTGNVIENPFFKTKQGNYYVNDTFKVNDGKMLAVDLINNVGSMFREGANATNSQGRINTRFIPSTGNKPKIWDYMIPDDLESDLSNDNNSILEDAVYDVSDVNSVFDNYTETSADENGNAIDANGEVILDEEGNPIPAATTTTDADGNVNVVTNPSDVDKRTPEEIESEWMSNWMSLSNDAQEMSPDNWGYNPDDYKDDIPFADLARSAGAAIIGMEMEETPLPLRNDQVSDAYKGYAAQMAEIAKKGLSVEEEADFNNKLTNAYAIGIDQLVRSSGGNRNIILGNQGRLDTQYQEGLSALSIEDSRRRMEGLQSYGEAMKYISEYDAKRDVANNEREYEKAKARRENGGNLTEAAWTAFGNSLNYWENNRPGSANHMSETMRLRNLFHYDRGLKNQDDPNQMYSLAWNRAKNEETLKGTASQKRYQEIYSQLNNEQRALMNKYGHQTGMLDVDSATMFGEYLLQGGDQLDFEAMNADPVDYFTRNVKPKNEIDPMNTDPYKSGAEIINPENNVQVSENNPLNWTDVAQGYDYGKIDTKDQRKDLFQQITETGTNLFNNIFANDNSRMA